MEHEDFVNNIIKLAKENLERDGSLTPIAFIHTPQNQVLLAPLKFENKELEMAMLRRICIEKEADFILMISEAWMKKFDKKEEADYDTPVGQQEGKVEIVIFSLETIGGGTWMGVAEMKEVEGKKTFDTNIKFDDTNLQGRLTNILPDKAYKPKF